VRKKLLINILLAGMLVQGMPVQTVYAEEMDEQSEAEITETAEQDESVVSEETELQFTEGYAEPKQFRINLDNAAIADAEGNIIEERSILEGTDIYLVYIPEDSDRDEFVNWDVYTETGNRIQVKNNSFRMPSENVYVEAEFNRYFFISITGGKADKQKAIAGETVSISLNKLGDNEDFQGWVSGTGNVSFADSKSTSTSFVMPVEDVTVTGKVVKANGFKVIDGKTYYFSNGIKATGWKAINNQWYYFESNGVMVIGWKKISNKWYYFKASGVMVTGWNKINGKWYRMNKSGAMLTGWQQSGGKWYYLDSSGAMQTGWKKISNKWYYFKASGVMVTGWNKINGKWYCMNKSGAMLTGWQQSGGKWYYLNTSSGAMVTGWQKISNKWYYFEASGAMVTGWNEINGKWYYMNKSGAMLTGFQQSGGKWYYMNKFGVMQTGWQIISNQWYYFQGSGAMVTGIREINRKYYKFSSSGVYNSEMFCSLSNARYILNTSTLKIHTPGCRDVVKISSSNKQGTTWNIGELGMFGYSPCKHCLK